MTRPGTLVHRMLVICCDDLGHHFYHCICGWASVEDTSSRERVMQHILDLAVNRDRVSDR